MSTPHPAPLILAGVLLAGLIRCEPSGGSAPSAASSSKRLLPREGPDAAPTALASSLSEAAQPLTSSANADADATPSHPAANTEGCPDGMVRVSGEYCPGVVQVCEKYHREFLQRKGNGTVSERCLKYKEPSRCIVDSRKHLDFCMDRYEYPNEVGQMPWVLTSWRQAQRLCRKQGKRLCSEDEFNFACEGPEMLPYVNGYTRDPKACNIDREYEQPDHTKRLLTYERCLEDAACKEEFERLDKRHAIGSSLTCVSWAGVVDLNGNVNEWVKRPHQEPPNRSGLKGGWWGPVRNRCRPTVRFHKEFDYGYEAGFRCCKGLGEDKPDPRYEQERFKISPEELEERKEKDARKGAPVARLPPKPSAPDEAPASPASTAHPESPPPDEPSPDVSATAPRRTLPPPATSISGQKPVIPSPSVAPIATPAPEPSASSSTP